MKLYIQDQYFEAIKSGKKKIEYREAHLTLVNIKTKELIECEITGAKLIQHEQLPKELRNKPFLKEEFIVAFEIGEIYGVRK